MKALMTKTMNILTSTQYSTSKTLVQFANNLDFGNQTKLINMLDYELGCWYICFSDLSDLARKNFEQQMIAQFNSRLN